MNYETYRGIFNVDLNVGATPYGEWDIPLMCRVDANPPALVAYDRINREDNCDKWVHFCIHDQRFMGPRRNPWGNLTRLQRFAGAIAPDFSLFWNCPRYMQLEAVCRSRAVGAWLQRNACGGVPFMRWGLKETYSFAFSAVEPSGTVAVGTVGCFGTKGKSRRSRVRNIASDNPGHTAAEFAYLAAANPSVTRPISGKGFVWMMRDGGIVTYRWTSSSDGTPVVELECKGISGIVNQKIHFIPKKKGTAR